MSIVSTQLLNASRIIFSQKSLTISQGLDWILESESVFQKSNDKNTNKKMILYKKSVWLYWTIAAIQNCRNETIKWSESQGSGLVCKTNPIFAGAHEFYQRLRAVRTCVYTAYCLYTPVVLQPQHFESRFLICLLKNLSRNVSII